MSEANLLDIPDDELEEYINRLEADLENTGSKDTDNEVDEVIEEVTEEEPEEPTEDDSTEEVQEEPSEEIVEPEESKEALEAKPDDTTVQDTEAGIDYKKEYERVLQPFNANGRTIKVDSIDDAITLMQMGANYNKKMADLKPFLKVNKLLEKNGLLDENRLSSLIEISKGNQAAIKKAVADSGLDPFELNAEEDAKYQAPKHTVNDSELELDNVLADIKESPSFSKTVDVVGRQLDSKSKEEILKNPNIIRVLHNDVETGRYDSITSEVAKLRALGKIPTHVHDLEAYGYVASVMDQQTQQVNPQTQIKTELPSQQKQKNVEKVNAQRKAAAPTRKSVSKTKPVVDLLSLSDDEFSKLAQDGLFKTV